MHLSMPGGPFGDYAGTAPFSRLPRGCCVQSELPSLLDYSLVSRGRCLNSFLAWDGVPADHALFGVVVKGTAARPLRKKTCWVAMDHRDCVEWLSCTTIPDFSTAQQFEEWCVQTQTQFADTRTCEQRRCDRWPPELGKNVPPHGSDILRE